jgi:hypothetical protein
LFAVDITLTKQGENFSIFLSPAHNVLLAGFEQVTEVISFVFQFLRLMKKAGIQEWFGLFGCFFARL